MLFTSYRMCSRAKKTFGEEIKAKYTRKAGPETVAALRANVLGPGQAAEGGHDEGDYLLRIQGKTKAANGGGGEVEERADGAGAAGGNGEAEGGRCRPGRLERGRRGRRAQGPAKRSELRE